MKKLNATSVDVARRAGVSQSVVSRTFARGPTQSGVSDATRSTVMAAAEELGYRPNAFARSLITQRSHGVEGFTKAMAVEWGRHCVRVNTIARPSSARR